MSLILNNPQAFAKHIERQVHNEHMSYMEAIIEFCTSRGIEIETIVPFVTDKMKSELAREGLALNLLNKSKMDDALPF